MLLAGLATGGIYTLVAIGFVLLWQTSQTINFAQGEFVMLPAFFALAGMKWLGLPFSLAALLAIMLATDFNVSLKQGVTDRSLILKAANFSHAIEYPRMNF